MGAGPGRTRSLPAGAYRRKQAIIVPCYHCSRSADDVHLGGTVERRLTAHSTAMVVGPSRKPRQKRADLQHGIQGGQREAIM